MVGLEGGVCATGVSCDGTGNVDVDARGKVCELRVIVPSEFIVAQDEMLLIAICGGI